MKRLLILFLVFIIFNISGQSQTIYGVPINSSSKTELNKLFEKYDIFSIDVSKITRSLNSRGTRASVHLVAGNYDWNLDLFENDLFGSEFTQSVGTENGIIRTKKKPNVRTYQGYLKATRGGEVKISFADNMIIGFIENNGITYFVEPLQGLTPDARPNEFVIYSEKDVKPNANVLCSVDASKHTINDQQVEHLQKRAGCLEVEIALACDFTVVSARGGVGGAQNWATGVLNLVQTNYDFEFDDDIMFLISEIFAPASAGVDPWNFVNNIDNHLTVHRNEASNIYSQSYDVATAWTRKYTNGAVGLAWLSAVCSSFRYNVCSDFGTSNNNLRNLQAHELGHNFGCPHDAANSGFIMAPSVNGSSTWSALSINSVNNFVKGAGCLGPCSNGSPPLANFSATPKSGCAPLSVKFTDLSAGSPSNWLWEFPGGNPSVSTQANPTVLYSSYGAYDVTLTVSNSFGTDTKILYSYIAIDEKPVANFTFDIFDLDVNFNNISLFGTSYLWKFGDGQTSTEESPPHTYSKDGTYEVTLKVTNTCGFKEIKKTVVIVTPVSVDFKADTTYGCSGYSVKYTNLSSANTTKFSWEFPGGTPNVSILKDPKITYGPSGTFDVKLTGSNSRYSLLVTKKNMIKVDTVPLAGFVEKISTDSIFLTNQSSHGKSYLWEFGDGDTSTLVSPLHKYPSYGEYLVVLKVKNDCGIDIFQKKVTIGTKVIAKFKVSNQIGCAPYEVQFENLSFNATSYKWSFPGGVPATSTEAKPIVKYNAVGKYDVTLEARNSIDSMTISESQYISVLEAPKASFQQTISQFTTFFTNTSQLGTSYLWEFGDNTNSTEESPSHTYSGEGEYLVRLSVTNICGTRIIEKKVSVYLIPKVDFKAGTLKICGGDVVEFTDLSTNDVLKWAWQFEGGNPATSSLQNPIIRFDKQGLYGIKLSVENSNGSNFITKINYIEVLSPVLCPDKTKKKRKGSGGEDFRNDPLDSRSNTAFQIVPNPNNGQFVIQGLSENSEGLHIDIYNLVGRKLYSTFFNESINNGQELLNVNFLAAGTYIIRVVSDDEESIKRIIIQN